MVALDLCLSLTYTKTMITTITGKNQVTLPAEIVRELKLTPGTQLKWSIGRDGSLIATPQPKRAERAAALHGAGRKLLPSGVDPVRDLIAERLQEDADADAASADAASADAASDDDEARP
jgi:antitoxin component of MazEF toxin-antitoxin module